MVIIVKAISVQSIEIEFGLTGTELGKKKKKHGLKTLDFAYRPF